MSNLDSCPIRSEWIMDGAPVAAGRLVSDSPQFSAYEWSCTPGIFRWEYDCDEIVHFKGGSGALANVQKLSEIHDIYLGQSMHFRKGEVWIWSVEETVTKFAVFVFPPNFGARVWRRLRSLA